MLVINNQNNEKHVLVPTLFPDGTSQIWKVPEWVLQQECVALTWHFEHEREIMDLLSFAELKGAGSIELTLPYLPYARQDKAVNNNSTFNLNVFLKLIDGAGFRKVIIYSPHSTHLLEGKENLEICEPSFPGLQDEHDDITVIVYPDESARSRYSKNPELARRPSVTFQKQRDASTGVITCSKILVHGTQGEVSFPVSDHYAIIDDLCDGGRSFTKAAEQIREKHKEATAGSDSKHREKTRLRITLHVQLGVFSAGLPIPLVDAVFWNYRLLAPPCKHNFLLHTDAYKMAHMGQYPEKTSEIYSYMIARYSKKYTHLVFYGLQYYLRNYLSGRVTKGMVDEFVRVRGEMLPDVASSESVHPFNAQIMSQRLEKLLEIGYLPLVIKAVPEGTVLPVGHALVTVRNTHPDFFWLVGLVESLLLKVWNTCTVATYSRRVRVLCEKYAKHTCDSLDHVSHQVHDFGYRGCSSEETAMLSGSAHLLNFSGTDTVPAVAFAKKWYGPTNRSKHTNVTGSSVPATEHSVMCSYGRDDGEVFAFQRLLRDHPTGTLAIVSDSYDLWKVMTNVLPLLKHEIMARDGKLVIRPDSGDPERILLGDPDASSVDPGSPAARGVVALLADVFGCATNSKGYKVIDPHVGVLYGEGMYYERIERIFNTLKERGFASSTIFFGVGGILLQNHTRDDLGFAFKATRCVVDGQPRDIVKDPATDKKKRSHAGLIQLERQNQDTFVTRDHVTDEEEKEGLLQTVFENGEIRRYQEWEDIVALVKQ